MKATSGLLTLGAVASWFVSTAAQCTQSTFGNITLFGGQILTVQAVARNVSASVANTVNGYAVNVTGLSVCQVNVVYTHPGQGDNINVTVWLPQQGWTGRYMGVGGGGFAAQSGENSLVQPASLGFAASMTDAGHDPSNTRSAAWALRNPGNLNYPLLFDFARVAYNDMAVISKSVITSYYGSPARYSYWNGCSTGGRQGHQMAQSYPTQFNGILATAPAFNWARFVTAEYYPQLIMNTLNVYPRLCELQAITAAVVAACDPLDGVTDGIIAAPSLCNFDPLSVVNQTFTCAETGMSMRITTGAARVMAALWGGARTVEGRFSWFGLNYDASPDGLANTTCSGNGTCGPNPFPIATEWIANFVLKDNSTNIRSINRTRYDTIFRSSVDQYESIISANNPDLTDFKKAGGKLITWHGLADQLIPPNGTYNYYERLLAFDPTARDYYRFFPAPGVGHCRGGPGWVPGNAIQSLVNWVENGVAPETLEARTTNTSVAVRTVNLCAYPKQLAYKGGDINAASSFGC